MAVGNPLFRNPSPGKFPASLGNLQHH